MPLQLLQVQRQVPCAPVPNPDIWVDVPKRSRRFMYIACRHAIDIAKNLEDQEEAKMGSKKSLMLTPRQVAECAKKATSWWPKEVHAAFTNLYHTLHDNNARWKSRKEKFAGAAAMLRFCAIRNYLMALKTRYELDDWYRALSKFPDEVGTEVELTEMAAAIREFVAMIQFDEGDKK